MINNCYDLLPYLIERSGPGNVFHITPSSIADTGLADDVFYQYADQLTNMGFTIRYTRSLRITDEGLDFLK